MDYVVGMPGAGPLATPDAMLTFARHIEDLDFSHLGVADHIVIPRNVESRYPYTEDGKFVGGSGEAFEQFTTLSFLAGQTSKVRLLTTITVLPHRGPLQTAKSVATLDVLSGGRLSLGVGVGWMREEFNVIGARTYDHRGALSNEYLEAFIELWTSDNPTFAGKYFQFSNIYFEPKPIQKPYPPIWVAGESPPAIRRAARFGDVWFPVGNNPKFPLLTPEKIIEARDQLYHHAERYGRDPSKIEIAYGANWYDETKTVTLPNGKRRTFTGTADEIAGDISFLEGLGVRYIWLFFGAPTLERSLERMEYFAQEIRPLV
jgi:probable F420-dependent oxidoreductase